MSEHTHNRPTPQAIPEPHAVWGIPLTSVYCPQCDWHYFIRQGLDDVHCPHCFQANLTPLEDADEQLPYHLPPELIQPFTVSKNVVEQHIQDFVHDIPFAPDDLNVEALRSRVQRFYLPMWLVDSDIAATWEAEVGFNYAVVSHRERYNEGKQWTTEEHTETRIRWEKRIGQLTRHYNNILAPALDDHAALRDALGRYSPQTAHAYTPTSIGKSLIRLPDRAPKAAWSGAVPHLQATAASDCRQAAQADRIRHHRWAPTYTNVNWTQLLQPVYATYYVDDAGRPQTILINGQTGQLFGQRRASMRRAQQRAVIIAIIATVFLVLGLCLIGTGFMMPPVLIVGIILAILAVGGGAAGALVPILVAHRFNRQEQASL